MPASNLLVMSLRPDVLYMAPSGFDRALLRCINKHGCIPSGPQALAGSRAFFFFTISSQVMSLGFRGTNISGALGLGTGPIGSDVNTALDCSDSTSALSSSELANAVETCFSLIQLYMIWVFFNFD